MKPYVFTYLTVVNIVFQIDAYTNASMIDNMLNAQRWFDDERIEWITNRYSKPKLKFYQNFVVVDNESKKIISDDNL